jgi:protein-L-isoaspartate(D-aspartate) O-methyltransferase
MTSGTFVVTAAPVQYRLVESSGAGVASVNLEQARVNMIRNQVRSWEVIDERVLDVLRDVPREEFVPARHRKLAFSDLRIPLGHDQVMMKPIEQGRLLQGLGLDSDDEVLEVGTGSGFLTACLDRLAGRVTSLEILESLAAQARTVLEAQGVSDVDLRVGDVLSATFDDGAFDAIVVTASVPSIPDPLVRWLRPGGRLFIVRGRSPAMEALLLTRTESGRLSEQSLFDTDLPRLIGAEEPPKFQF